MRLIFCTIVILFYFTACSDSKDSDRQSENLESNISQKSFSFIKGDTLRIPIDEFTPYRSMNLQYVYKQDSSLLIWENRPLNSLEFYNLSDKKLIKRLRIPKGAANGMVASLAGFQYISEDSILLTDGSRYNFYLMNGKAQMDKEFDVLPQNTKTSVPIVYDNRPIMVKGDHAYIVCQPDKDYNQKGWFTGSLLLDLNLNSASFSYDLDGVERFKEDVHGAFFSHHSMTINNKGQIIVSFPIEQDLLIYNPKQKNYTWEYGGSKYFSEIPSWPNPESGQSAKFYIESNSYREIKYDQWRDVYYRMAYRAVDYKNTQGMVVNWDYKIPSIIILDNEFKKIGEYDLNRNEFYTQK